MIAFPLAALCNLVLQCFAMISSIQTSVNRANKCQVSRNPISVTAFKVMIKCESDLILYFLIQRYVVVYDHLEFMKIDNRIEKSQTTLLNLNGVSLRSGSNHVDFSEIVRYSVGTMTLTAFNVSFRIGRIQNCNFSPASIANSLLVPHSRSG